MKVVEDRGKKCVEEESKRKANIYIGGKRF